MKNVFHIAEFYLQEFSKSLSGLSTDGVLVECVDSDGKKDQIVKVLGLQQQLQSEMRNLMQNEMKLLIIKLNCRDCEENLTTYENTYNK